MESNNRSARVGLPSAGVMFSRLIHVARTGLHFFPRAGNACDTDDPHRVHLSVGGRRQCCLSWSALMSNAAVMYVLLRGYIYLGVEWPTQPHGNFMCNFVRNRQTGFQTSCARSRSHQPHMRFPFLHIVANTSHPHGEKWSWLCFRFVFPEGLIMLNIHSCACWPLAFSLKKHLVKSFAGSYMGLFVFIA